MSSEHEVILISLVDPTEAGSSQLPEVPGVAAQFQLPLPVFRSLSLRGLQGAFSRLPRSIVATWNDALSRQINSILAEHAVAVAIGTDLRTLRYLTNLPTGIARILDEPDASPFVTATAASRRSVRALAREHKYRRFLGTSRGELDTVVVASELELEAFAVLSGGLSTVISNVVPGLPAETWRPTSDTTLLYTGALTYRPNLDAVNFLVDDVLRAIELEHPGLQLTITGAIPEPPPAVCSSPLIEMTGNVPSLDSYYRQSRLFVVPLHAGTGTRIKLLEAMSYGMPIVSTRKGAEGLPVVDGEHLLLADSVDDFIAATLLLLEDCELCRRLGANARNLVAKRFRAEAVGELWRDLVAGAIVRQEERGGNG